MKTVEQLNVLCQNRETKVKQFVSHKNKNGRTDKIF